MSDWQDFSKRMLAYEMGLADNVAEGVKYAGLGANWLGNKVGLLSDQQMIDRGQAIRNVIDQGMWMPENFAKVRAMANAENPAMNKTGQYASSVVAAGPLRSAQLLAKSPWLARTLAANPVARAVGLGTGQEAVAEPAMDQVFLDQKIQKKQKQ